MESVEWMGKKHNYFVYHIAIAFFDEYEDAFTCDADKVDWLDLAEAINDCIMANDEARFSLYDYLDAILNTAEQSFYALLQEYNTNKTAFFEKLVEMAAHKRAVYEGVFNEYPTAAHFVNATRISYLYRDASNYKVYNDVCVPGIITEDEKRIILESCDDGYACKWFIPSMVGLPENRFEEWADQDDHPFFELTADSFETICGTPDVDVDILTLTKRFVAMKGKWKTAGNMIQRINDEPTNPEVPQYKIALQEMIGEVAATVGM